jgi:hypothetical protein
MKILNRFLIITLLVFVTQLFFGCSKENDLNSNIGFDELKCSNLLFFKDGSEVMEELQFISSLNLEEKIKWEKEKGFNSLGVKADIFYESINLDEFKSEKQFLEYVNMNNDFIEILETGGERSLETRFHRNSYRYIINEDRLFQVADTVYKLLNNCQISTSISNIEKIKIIEDNNLDMFFNDNDIRIIYPIVNNFKSTSSNCGKGSSGTTNAIYYNDYYYRTLVSINLSNTHDSWYGKIVAVTGEVGCQRRGIFGIWFNHKTGIFIDVEHTVSYLRYFDGVVSTYDYVEQYASWTGFINNESKLLYGKYYVSAPWQSSNPLEFFIKFRLKGWTHVPNSAFTISCGM